MDIQKQIILEMKKAIESEAKGNGEQKKVRKTRKLTVSGLSSTKEQKEA